MKKSVGIIDLGISNIFSVYNSILDFGIVANITKDRKVIDGLDYLILPGAGSFHEGMKSLKKNGLDEIIKKHILKQKPFLGICLGMQLLYQESSEFGNCEGLGILKGKVVPFKKNQKNYPHIGWNIVKIEKNSEDLKKINNNFFYFVHSYYVPKESGNDILLSSTFNKVEFCSGVIKNNIYAFQFHPEKSSSQGKILLGLFLEKKFSSL